MSAALDARRVQRIALEGVAHVGACRADGKEAVLMADDEEIAPDEILGDSFLGETLERADVNRRQFGGGCAAHAAQGAEEAARSGRKKLPLTDRQPTTVAPGASPVPTSACAVAARGVVIIGFHLRRDIECLPQCQTKPDGQ